MTDKRDDSGAVIIEEEEVDEPESCIQERYILALMGFFCFFVLSALRLNIGIAIVAMINWTKVREMQGLDPLTNETCHFPETAERNEREDGPFVWTTEVQGHVLGSYFYGLAATQFLGGRLSELISAKLVLLFGTLWATLCTFLIPFVAGDEAFAVVVLQIFKGFGQGIMMPAFSVLMGKWIPAGERARFMSFITSGIPVGGFITVIVSGVICKTPSLGWKYVFYVFGTVGAMWCVLWYLLIHDSPLLDPHITRRELNRIMSLRSQKAPQLRFPVPLKDILTSKPVWAYIAAGFASFWCLSLYVSVVPLFMGTILKFDIEQNGMMSAVPNLVEAFFLVFTSLISDHLLKKKILSPTVIRKLFISTGLCGYAICMVVVTFTGCNRGWSVFFLVVALGTSGFNFASTAVVPVDMSPRFAGTISGIMNTFGALSGVIIPSAIGYLTRNRQTMDEWSIVFYTSAMVCVFAVIIFIAFGSSEVQPWNNPPPDQITSDLDLQGENFINDVPVAFSQNPLVSRGATAEEENGKTTRKKSVTIQLKGEERPKRKKSVRRPSSSPRKPSVVIPENWNE